MTVQEGDIVVGNLTQTGAECWDVVISSGSVSSKLNVCDSSLARQQFAFVADEAYITKSSDALSATLPFRGLQLFKSGTTPPPHPPSKTI